MRYRIEVRGRRGDHAPYTYTQYDRVKAAKVQRLIDKTVIEVAQHESGGQRLPMARFIDGIEDRDGFIPVTVRFKEYDIEFTVLATPILE